MICSAPLEPRLRLRSFDNDGYVDILIVNLNEPPSLLRNDLPLEFREESRHPRARRTLRVYPRRSQRPGLKRSSRLHSASHRSAMPDGISIKLWSRTERIPTAVDVLVIDKLTKPSEN